MLTVSLFLLSLQLAVLKKVVLVEEEEEEVVV